MELVLWRHADAVDAAPGTPDAERALSARGEREAQRMAAWLRQRLPDATRVLASPARRAQQTARALPWPVETVEQVGTEASPQDILRACGWPAGERTVLVVGHQPTLGQAAALAITGRPADWTVRKGAVWWLESRADGAALRAVLAPDLLE